MKNMKRKVLLAGMSLLVMTMVCYCSFHEEKIESALLMENIEALAGGESHVPMHCVGSGTVDCPINHEKVKMVATGYSLEDSY